MRTLIYDEEDQGKTKPDKIFPREFIAAEAIKAGYSLASILSHDKRKCIVKVRWDIARALRARGMSYAQIGKAMNRDHSTIIHAVRS